MLLLLHGISQQEYIGKEEDLRAKWVDLLRRGLQDMKQSNAKVEEVLDQCRMIFYADLTDPNRIGDAPGTRHAKIELYERLIDQEIDNELARKRGLQNTLAAHRLAAYVDRFPELRKRMVRMIAREAYGYFERPGAPEEVDERCQEAIRSDKFALIVSHSFGTIIAYRLLSRVTGLSERLVTLGSPLGSPFMRTALAVGQTRPFATLSNWSAFADPNAIVSYVPIDIPMMFAEYKSPPPQFVSDRTIENTTDNQHSIEGYIGHPKVVAAIVEAFSRPEGVQQ